MKTTFLKTGLIAGLLLIAEVSFADVEKRSKSEKTENSEYLNVEVTPLQNKFVRMSFEKLQGEKVKINVYDQYGERLYTETVKDKSIVYKKFDLTNVPSGNYSFEVYNDIFKVKRTVEVK